MRSRAVKNARSKRQNLAQFIALRRQGSGLAIEEIATYIAVSVSVLEDYESAKRAIPLNRLYGIANCLNISPEELLEKL